MKIIFFNILDFVVADGLKNFFVEHEPSTQIFALQEVFDKSKDMLDPVLIDYQMIDAYKCSRENDVFPMATYVRNKYKILETFELVRNIRWAGLGLASVIQLPDRKLNLVNVHGASKPGNKLDTPARLKQSELLIERFQDDVNPTIIGGDFNLELNIESIRMFEKAGYRNLITEFKIENTRNKLAWDKYPDSKQYYSDYVFAKGDVNVKSLTAPYSEISDHLPLILEIENF